MEPEEHSSVVGTRERDTETFVLAPTGLRKSALVCALVSAPVFAHAETMSTSYYRAEAPHHAAHRTLPMGTQLKVTNPRNGRTARVIISTRGPFIRGRALDVSHTVAKQLGFEKSGVVHLYTQVVGR
jgi:rare lipoprotein A